MKALLLACLLAPSPAAASAFAELAALAAPGETTPAGAGRFRREPARVVLRGAPPDGRPAAVLIHGLLGSPEEMSAIAARLERSHQVYFLEFPDLRVEPSANGAALAARLAQLRAAAGDGRPLLIVAHSLGGFVARAALNEMTASGELARWGAVRAVCVDTPWHGIVGPGWRLPLPGALDELHARGPLLRAGFLSEPVAPNASIELVFAAEGIAAKDYTERALRDLPEALARHFSGGEPVRGSPRLMNFWRALQASSQYPAFSSRLRAEAAARPLDAAAVLAALHAHFPRLPGRHGAVLSSPELLDAIAP
ncbi:MAG: hypothetical protein SF051_14375 [Elusimicrobiota bacterium]|nr:hypothetical protein [Elusimicrobiota bacterium]